MKSYKYTKDCTQMMNIVLAVVKNVVSQGGARDLGKVLEL